MSITTSQQSLPKSSTLARVQRILLSWRFLRLAVPGYVVLMSVVWLWLLFLWIGGSSGRDRTGGVLGPDFLAFYTGGWLVRHHESNGLYDLLRQQSLQQTLLPGHDGVSAFINPPQFALLIAPLSMLPYASAFVLWTGFMVAAFIASVILVYTRLPMFNVRHSWLLMALALFSPPVYFALSAGQNTGLSLLLHTCILIALVKGRDTLAGILIALGMFKPQLFVVLLPLLLIDRRWRALISFGLASAFIGLLTLWWFDRSTVSQWINTLQGPTYQSEIIRQASKMFSWQAFWTLLLGQSFVATALGWLSALSIVAGLCYLWWRFHADLPMRYAVTICGIIVMGPHLFVYDLGLLILPGLIIGDRLLHIPSDRWMKMRLMWMALYIIVFFAIQAQPVVVLIVVPLITLLGILGVRMLQQETGLAAVGHPFRPD